MHYCSTFLLLLFTYFCFAQTPLQEPVDFDILKKDEWCEKAFNSLEEGKYEIAHAYFTVAMELDSTFIVPYLGRIQTKKMTADKDGAIEDYQKLIQVDTLFQSIDLIKKNRDSTFYAILAENGYRFSDAPHKWDTMLYANNDLEKPLSQKRRIQEVTFITPYERGVSYLSKGKLDKALQYFNEALTKNSNLKKGYLQRAKTKTLLGDFEGAFDDYDNALAFLPPYGEIFFFRANTYLLTNNLLLALIDFNNNLKIHPNNPEAHFGRARVHGGLKNYNAALKDYKQALELNPNLTKVYVYRGRLHQENNFMEKACQDWEKGMQKNDAEAKQLWIEHCK